MGKQKTSPLRIGLLFISPVLIGYVIFIVVPLIMTLYLSMTDYSIGANQTHFIGLSNFKDMLTGKDNFFWPSMKATGYYVLVSVPLGITVSFLIAVLLNRKIALRGFFRSVFYLPVVIPLASSCVIWMWMLQPDFGIINAALESVGVPGPRWLSSEDAVIPTFILFSLWISGGTIVIFLAGLQSIPSHLYEAIEIDGGNAWHRLRYITIPMSSSVIFFNLVMGFINALQTFVQPAIMTGGGSGGLGQMGGPNNSSLLIVAYIFQNGFRFSDMGMASAGAMILFLIAMVFTLLIFRFGKSWVYYEGDGRR
ncbi:carbohydrate ABC transporter permease [Cohnella boryungensis]|uniref:Carbohydrate ABC transporter permease n=1 Tax=Cohnella boryungensis TaxID=768479 RepID=A0ABV8SFG0_9BACL